jgi:hypothetical protein
MWMFDHDPVMLITHLVLFKNDLDAYFARDIGFVFVGSKP